jgi:hypothetical protein
MKVLLSFESSKSIRQSAQCKIQIFWLKVARNVETTFQYIKLPPLKLLNEVQIKSDVAGLLGKLFAI